jgi:hypothetical protein
MEGGLMPQAIPFLVYAAATYVQASAIIASLAAIAASVAVGDHQRKKARRQARDAYNASLRDRLVMLSLADGPRSRIYGRARNVDGILFKATRGADSRIYTLIIALAGHESDAIEDVYFSDLKVELDADGYVQTAPYGQSQRVNATASMAISGGAGSVVLPHTPVPGSVAVAFPYPTESGGNGEILIPYTLSGSTVSVTNADPAAPPTVTVSYQYDTTRSYARVRKYLGGAGQDLSASLMADFPGLITSTDKFAGITLLRVDLEYSQDAFPSGLPSISAVVRGVKCFDPRTSTTAWTRNPALHARDWALYAYGGGCTAAQLNTTLVNAAANACDVSTNFTTPSGTVADATYRAGGAFRLTGDPTATMDEIIEAMAGRWGWDGSQIRMTAGAYRAPVATITEDWLHEGGDISIATELPYAEAVNSYRVTIADEAQQYTVLEAPPVAPATYIAADGQELQRPITAGAITSAVHAQHVASVLIREARQGLTLKMALKPRHGLQVELLETIALDLPHFGFEGKVMEILETGFSINGGVVVTLKEHLASNFTPNSTFDELGYTDNTSLPSPTTVPAITGLAAASGTEHLQRLADGTVVTRVRVSWTPVNDRSITESGKIEVRFGRATQPEDQWQTIEAEGGESSLYIVGAADASILLIKARARNTLGVRGIWSQHLLHSVVGKTAPPNSVASISYTLEPFGVNLTWPPVPDLDVTSYELRQGGTSWETATALAGGTQTLASKNWYQWRVQTSGTRTVRIKAVDSSGNYSLTAASTSIVIDVPGIPAVTYALDGKEEIISWTEPAASFAIAEYEIRHGATWAGGTVVARVKGLSYRRPVGHGGARDYHVAAVDVGGNVGAAGFVSTLVTVPGEVTAARAEVVDNNVLLYWNEPAAHSLPIDRYEVRKGATWAGGTVVGSNGNSTFGFVFEQQSGNYSYWVTAYDSAGNEGTPTVITAMVSQPPDYILRSDINSDFTIGTLSNMWLEAGSLYGPVPQETDATHYSSRSWTNDQDAITAGSPGAWQPSATSCYYEEQRDYGTVLPATAITTTITLTTLSGSVTAAVQVSYKVAIGDAWTDATAGATTVFVPGGFRYVKIRWTLTASGGNDLARISLLNIRLNVKLRTDSGKGSAVSTDSGGTTVNFGVPFIDVETITVSAKSTVARYSTYDFTDTPNPTSFKVLLFDTSGNRVSGEFSWDARGY